MIKLTQEENIWVVECHEKLAFQNPEEAETAMKKLIEMKKKNGNLRQMMEEQRKENEKRKLKNRMEKEAFENKMKAEALEKASKVN